MTSTNDEKHEFVGSNPPEFPERCEFLGGDDVCGQPRSAAIHGVVSETFACHAFVPLSVASWCGFQWTDVVTQQVATCGREPSDPRHATEPPADTEASEAPPITAYPPHEICEQCREVGIEIGKVAVHLCPHHRSLTAQVARLREALRGAQATIESMRSENKLHGHITDASAFYLHHSKPLIDAALKGEGK